jgi:capsular polysaccharide biosynthesis protein
VDPVAQAEAQKRKVQAALAKTDQAIAQRKKAQQAQDQQRDTNDAAQQIINVETEWARLSREQARTRQRLADLEAKVFRAEIAAESEEGGYAAQIAVLDPAYKPTAPSSMARSRMAMAGFFVSFLLGIALAAARGIMLDDRVYDAEDIERLGLAPVLAVVPAMPRRLRRRRG